MILIDVNGPMGLWQCPDCGDAKWRKSYDVIKRKQKRCRSCANQERKYGGGSNGSTADFVLDFAMLLTEVWVACTGGGRGTLTWTLAACNVVDFIGNYGHGKN